jgi:DnaJ like chaperone protein
MSIWTTLLGGAAGLALGGPIGALLGAYAGHAAGRRADAGGDDRAGTRSAAFTLGVIVLGAKMAKADGRVSVAEVVAFREVFRVPDDQLGNVARIFDRAKREVSGFEPYAEQLARLFPDNPAVLEELLDALFHIAKADGGLHATEEAFLRRVAGIFGFGEADYQRIHAGHVAAGDADPYEVLGMARDASDEALREHHPDVLIAQGLPQEFVDLATAKLAVVNDAWDRIRRHRGLG